VSAHFDPYHKWLGISPKDQPPDHYRLLGVDRFEADPDVIAGAADKQMAHVRSLQIGKHPDLSQRILNEIAAARVCLLNPSKKEEYDRQLRQKPESGGPKPLLTAEPLGAAMPAPSEAPLEPPAELPAFTPREPPRRASRSWQGPAAVGATVVVGALVIALIVFSRAPDGPGGEDLAQGPAATDPSLGGAGAPPHPPEQPPDQSGTNPAADVPGGPPATLPVADDGPQEPIPADDPANSRPPDGPTEPPETPARLPEAPAEPTDVPAEPVGGPAEPGDVPTEPGDDPAPTPETVEEAARRLREELDRSETEAEFRAVAAELLAVSDRAIVEGKIDLAKELTTLALVASRKTDDTELKGTVALRIVELEKPLEEARKAAAERLQRAAASPGEATVPEPRQPRSLSDLLE